LALPARAADAPDASLLSVINAEDKAGSADALTEYKRRAALLPQVERLKQKAIRRPTTSI